MEGQAQERKGWARPRGCLGIAIAGLLLLIAAPILLLTLANRVSRVEAARAESPDGAIDAALIEINGGAKTDFAYSVRLHDGWFGPGREVASLYGAHRSECAYGVNLRWTAPDRLLIEYQDAARAETFPAQVDGRKVIVELRPGIIDRRAPCGGMEYNLLGRPYG